MAQQFTNNARSTLASTIDESATALTIQAGAADLFPTANVNTGSIPSTNSWFKATIQDSSGNVEIIYVRTRNAGSPVFSNVLRGQEGTTARSFVAGAIVGLRITAADIQGVLDLPGNNSTFTGDNTFTGVVQTPNQSFGTNDTTIANTAFVQAALQALHPVGSIYINATDSTNPGTLLGFGTWAAFGAGRVMVGFNASDPLFDSAEETGGSKDAVVVAHTHTGTTSTAGNHNHMQRWGQGSGDPGGYAGNSVNQFSFFGSTGVTADAGNHNHSFTTNSTGSSGTNANLQPYITVFMWKRTA